MLLDTTIKTSNGSGNTLLITPSAVTGLFTSTNLSSTVTTAKADIGVKVCVQVVGGRVLPNETPNATDTSCVVYDQRFQQISNTLFTNVALCAAGNAGTVCTSDADCSGGTVCGPPDLTGTQTCTCGFDLTLSTLAAHSYNFIAQVPGDNKPHHVRATWKLTGVNQSLGYEQRGRLRGAGRRHRYSNEDLQQQRLVALVLNPALEPGSRRSRVGGLSLRQT